MRRECLIVLMIGVIAGCESPSDAVVENDGLEVIVDASPEIVSAGAPVKVVVSVINTTSQSITKHFGEDCTITFEVESGTGDVVYPDRGWVCPRIISELTVAPGDTARREYQISVTGGPDAFAPGTYRVYGGLGASVSHRSAPDEIVVQ